MSDYPLPETGAVLGGDVGWSTNWKSSAAYYLVFDKSSANVDTARFTAHPGELEQSLSDLLCYRPSLLAAAFDGPFRRDLDRIGIYRNCEKVLTVRLARHIGKLGQSSSGNERNRSGWE